MHDLIETGLHYETAAGAFPILASRSGVFWIYDPQRLLIRERATIAPARRAGMGDAKSAAISVVAGAASFIPVVGPVLGPLIGAIGSLFGGGDPTALSILMDNIMQLRAKIADAHRALGIADDFQIPPGFNAQDKKAAGPPVDAVVTEVLGATESQIQGDRRADYYKAIAALKSIADQLTAEAHDQAIIAEVRAMETAPVAPSPAPASSLPAPANDSGAPPPATQEPASGAAGVDFTTILPWLVGGLGLVILAGRMSQR